MSENETQGAAYRGLLSEMVRESGLSIAEFARVAMGRDERTVRRWLTGEIAIPESAAQWLARVEIEVRPSRVVVTVHR